METAMQIDGDQVRQLREGRAWSQEHLAQCAGVSLRTVQRVEAEGGASHETILALASALEVTPMALRSMQPVVRVGVRPGHTLGVITGTAGALIGVSQAWWSVLSAHMQGAQAGEAFGKLGLLTGMSCAFLGVVWEQYRRVRRGESGNLWSVLGLGR